MARTKEEYLREKGRLPKEPLGSMFFFESNRQGVSEIKEVLVWEQRESHGWRGGSSERLVLQVYKFEGAPWSATFWPGDIVVEERGCGSGTGDLWSWSHFTSPDKKALEKARTRESKRIRKKYKTLKEKHGQV